MTIKTKSILFLLLWLWQVETQKGLDERAYTTRSNTHTNSN